MLLANPAHRFLHVKLLSFMRDMRDIVGFLLIRRLRWSFWQLITRHSESLNSKQCTYISSNRSRRGTEKAEPGAMEAISKYNVRVRRCGSWNQDDN